MPEVGDDVTALAPDDHVVMSFVATCGHCRWCASGAHYLVLLRFRNAMQAGEIRADTELEPVADALIGAPVYRMLAHLEHSADTARRSDALADVILRGLRPG